MRALQKFVALFLCVLILFGCSGRSISESAPPEASTPSKSESQISVIKSPPAELKVPQTITIYRYFSEGQIYEAEETTYSDEENLLAVINHIIKALDIPEPLPILGITQQKSFVVIDFDENLLNQYDKRELDTLLTTLVMTLRQNVASVWDVQFKLDGEIGVFGETFEPAPLAFAPGDPAEFAAICASIPYEGLQIEMPYLSDEMTKIAEPADETAKEIVAFLIALGKIEKDAASPAELDRNDLFYSCINATAYYWSRPYESEPERYRKELAPIADSVSAKMGMLEDMFWIADHVRQTAKLLCGDDYVLPLDGDHYSKWRYFELEGVITPPHMGGSYGVLPIVLDYKATADGYRVEAAYIYAGEGGYFLWGQGDTVIPENQLINKAPRREIILKRANDGKLRFISHRFL
ncbi:MAG: hypothetical protein K0S22_2358 [Oscillospiraceae bacterium]|jgi:hypothetical protein|nr:hypothetical protein [Oscillospiraceae bacterium]